MVSGEAAWQGRHSCASATAAGGLQGLQALFPRRWPPLGAFIKLPALRGVHDTIGYQSDMIRRIIPGSLERIAHGQDLSLASVGTSVRHGPLAAGHTRPAASAR